VTTQPAGPRLGPRAIGQRTSPGVALVRAGAVFRPHLLVMRDREIPPVPERWPLDGQERRCSRADRFQMIGLWVISWDERFLRAESMQVAY
jgi:hypothetical protein